MSWRFKSALLVGPLAEKGFLKKLVPNRTKRAELGILAVDAGVRAARLAGVQPDFAIGDWDSLGFAPDLPHASYPKNKNRSDLSLALEWVITHGTKNLMAAGFLGGRSDHHLASLLEFSLAAGGDYGPVEEVLASGKEGSFFFISGRTRPFRMPLRRKQRLSVFPMSADVQNVSLKGLRYSLPSGKFNHPSHGLSNEVRGKECQISLKKGSLLIVIPNHREHA